MGASTAAIQDYLKTIYSISLADEQVSTTSIAHRLGVTPASATAMIKRLAGRGYLKHRRYRGVELTASGRRVALEVVRHHRLLESYLHEALGMEWDCVHDEAEVLEHAISEELEDRIDEMLGHPSRDPHGDPIPPRKGRHVEPVHTPLEEFPAGRAIVQRISDRDPEALRFLGRLGIKPGARINVEGHSPFEGAVWVRIGRKRHALGSAVAQAIYVSGESG